MNPSVIVRFCILFGIFALVVGCATVPTYGIKSTQSLHVSGSGQVPGSWSEAYIADFNADGRSDTLALYYSPSVGGGINGRLVVWWSRTPSETLFQLPDVELPFGPHTFLIYDVDQEPGDDLIILEGGTLSLISGRDIPKTTAGVDRMYIRKLVVASDDPSYGIAICNLYLEGRRRHASIVLQLSVPLEHDPALEPPVYEVVFPAPYFRPVTRPQLPNDTPRVDIFRTW